MKQHFTYQLNEEKIRKQLKELSASKTEGAWEKFAEYSNAQPGSANKRSLPQLNLQLNRKTLLSAAAVLVIVLLSVLVVNFTGNSSNSKKQQKASVNEPFVPMPSLNEPEITAPPLARSENPKPAANGNSDARPSDKPTLVKEELAQKPLTKKKTTKDSIPAGTLKTPEMQTASTQGEVKKKRREGADLLQPVQLPDIRPVILTEEQEEDIRPN